MTFRVVIAKSAKADLQEIVDFIAADNPERAISFVGELQERTTNLLAAFPESGRRYNENTRFIAIRNYTVLYEFEEGSRTVYVLHIFPKGRNWREVDEL
jgi:toxin ParE1/3/4